MGQTIHLNLLQLNTYLMGGVGAKPAVAARALEIGRIVRDYYDVAALSEVWRRAERRLLLGSWGGRRPYRAWDRHRGEGKLRSSGLLTISNRRPISRKVFQAFRDPGVPPDSLVRKGVLLAEVSLPGPGALEVYSTHLFASGFQQTRAQYLAHRLAQLDELRAFIARTHRPQNTMILVGNLNLDADDPKALPHRFSFDDLPEDMPPYGHLVRALDRVGLRDAWPQLHPGAPGPTNAVHRRDDQGHRLAERMLREESAAPDLCREPGASAWPASKRIDYLFIAQGTSPQAPRLRVEHLRRALFRRAPDAPAFDALPYVSDHLGLHVGLRLELAG